MFLKHFSMYPIKINSVCFKVFIVDSGEEFYQLVNNCVFYIRK